MARRNTKLSYNDSGIFFSDINKSSVKVGAKISNRGYAEDPNNIGYLSYATPVVNAVDIDWNNAYLSYVDNPISSTGQLLAELNSVIGETKEITRMIDAGEISGGGGPGDGIPIYDADMIAAKGDKLPEQYIEIPNANNINDRISNPIQYESTGNGHYLDIIFSSLRSLQSEVARLRNSFRYGIYSYNGYHTAMSAAVDENKKIPEEEPLWAIDEEELSAVSEFDCPLSDKHTLTPTTSVKVGTDLLKVLTRATWQDEQSRIAELTDAKLFVYLTTTSMDIQFKLQNLDDESDVLTIDLSQLGVSESVTGKYNILFILQRAQTYDDSTTLYGDNYVYISIGDYGTGEAKLQGYWKNNALHDSVTLLGGQSDSRYTIDAITFNELSIYKFNMYSRYQNFMNNVDAMTPDDDDYKYKVAHITIRSVDTYAVLTDIKDQLPPNELIFVESTDNLYIKTKSNKLIKIGSGNTGPDDDSDMPYDDETTMEEIIETLEGMGIVQNSKKQLELNPVESVTFVHNDTGKAYKFKTNAYGELESNIVRTDTVANRLGEKQLEEDFHLDRGVVAQVRFKEANKAAGAYEKDGGLLADRVKISAIYAPLKTDAVYGCTHAYIELENTSDKDWNLEGCYLHYARTNDDDNNVQVYHLALDGYIPAGGTYLIRGKQYAYPEDKNVYINVSTYDKEWYVNNELIDLSMVDERSLTTATKIYVFLLTYGLENVAADKIMTKAPEKTESGYVKVTTTFGDYTPTSKSAYMYAKGFIDSTSINSTSVNSNCGWCPSTVFTPQKSNCIYKITFALDPAKQAFNSLTTIDSSRQRWANAANDSQFVTLDKEYITFPNVDEKFPVANYTPHASFEHKNVCTDKTKLDREHPNMVTCSFGVNGYTTRCFNWISVGMFDEFVWIYDSSNNLVGKFESYKHRELTEHTHKDTSGTVVSDGYFDDEFIKYNNDIENSETVYPIRKEFPYNVNNIVYASVNTPRFVGRFPADNTFYTSHKCVIDVVKNAVNTKITYTYIVGRADASGNPDIEHCSDAYYFTLYPQSYTPRVYQTTDQQGFHWIEYQAWAMAANEVEKQIQHDCENEQIIPVLINTGDMTQNGTRINEWFDYYQGGKVLFRHLEQMNCVGNNDLCGTDINALGTGDDTGKSNSFFFHIFYCYEVSPIYLTADTNHETPIYPIVNGKYIPSLYQFEFGQYKFIFVNSEITLVNCRDWFNLKYTDNDIITADAATVLPVNIYTGYTLLNAVGDYKSKLEKYVADDLGFTPIYTMLYHMTEDADTKKTIVFCHEMPFTVITNASIATNQISVYRSLSDAAALVGCHMNQIVKTEVGAGTYWFSRLLEYRNIKLCVGGHKHTFMLTYPLAENYKYRNDTTSNEWHNSNDGGYIMEETLASEQRIKLGNTILPGKIDWSSTSSYFKDTDGSDAAINTTKFPYTVRNDVGESGTEGYFYPYKPAESLTHSVVYLMCQATGYKQTSNKELPTAAQKFSRIIPKTAVVKGKDTASNDQKYPMFSVLTLSPTQINIKLGRILNVMNKKFKFTQFDYGNGNTSVEWCKQYGELISDTSGLENFAVWATLNSNTVNCEYVEEKKADDGTIIKPGGKVVLDTPVTNITMETINW